MSFASIDRALTNAWVANDEFGLPTAYENKDFIPEKSLPWASLHHLPTDSRVASLGIGGTDMHTGLLQIDLNYPLNTGKGRAFEKADEIATFFKAGSKVSYEGVHVTIETSKLEHGRHIFGMYRISISVYYYTRTPR